MISHFMCAVAVSSSIPGQHPSVFHSFCKVGTGYTMNELHELDQLLHPHWRPFDTKRPPETVILAPGYKEKPDVWIEPTKSKIVQVKAAEIITSDKFKTGVTLRFPRVEAIRKDKMWYECLSSTELEKLKSDQRVLFQDVLYRQRKVLYSSFGISAVSEMEANGSYFCITQIRKRDS
ncbi:PREDICTED: DNA ligase 4-like [Acropora digitifera]|uniref:DNA ligase 4-like n=1 Tax=Acropora digitifera TaxID=70779 RepID=UPI00077A82CE|nr:PREDICTED: DNA ligase 4-like [Acropora digitifera]